MCQSSGTAQSVSCATPSFVRGGYFATALRSHARTSASASNNEREATTSPLASGTVSGTKTLPRNTTSFSAPAASTPKRTR